MQESAERGLVSGSSTPTTIKDERGKTNLAYGSVVRETKGTREPKIVQRAGVSSENMCWFPNRLLGHCNRSSLVRRAHRDKGCRCRYPLRDPRRKRESRVRVLRRLAFTREPVNKYSIIFANLIFITWYLGTRWHALVHAAFNRIFVQRPNFFIVPSVSLFKLCPHYFSGRLDTISMLY